MTDLQQPPGPLSETYWIDKIRRRAACTGDSAVPVGIGDDGAVIRGPEGGREILATTDQIIESKHFIRDLHPPDALGRKTLARGLSDIAAMGGRPDWFLLSLALPAWARQDDWFDSYLDGLFGLVEELDCKDLTLVGGDLAADERLAAHITVIGSVEPGAALLRSAARPGHRIWVSGPLGGSDLGLARLLEGAAGPGDAAVERHLRPTPRLALGRTLRQAGAEAAIDISDGLSTDLARILAASGVGAALDAAAIPVFPGATLEQALHGGEEYELLFTAPAGAEFQAVPIGEITSETGLLIDGKPLEQKGFDHFSDRP